MKLIIELSAIIIVLLAFILFLLYKIINNTLKIYQIRFNKATNNLKQNLHKKYDINLKIVEFFNKISQIDEEPLQNFLNINLKKDNLEELNIIMNEVDNYIEKHLQKNEKLVNDDLYKNITKDLNELNISINATRKYYNKNVLEYNKIIKKFPYNLLCKIKKYEQKTKLEETKQKELKILKGLLPN